MNALALSLWDFRWGLIYFDQLIYGDVLVAQLVSGVVLNVSKTINLYTPLELTRIDRSLVY